LILVTGAAGFIGFHVAQLLLARGETVIGIDNLNDYYDPTLKEARLALLRKHDSFDFRKLDLVDSAGMKDLFASEKPGGVVHLAAQAGVRYSLTNPDAYVASNIQGFLNVLEACRANPVKHLVYASTSSVYGLNTRQPLSEHDSVNHPVSLYGATKKANELMAHSYAHLFRMPVTGLRFFTVYGPWGRPDMALFLFTRAILAGEAIQVFNNGRMVRDFTFVDDIAEGVIRVLDRPAQPDPAWVGSAPDPASSSAPYRIFNIGNNRPVELMTYIAALERTLGRKATIDFLPMQPGDVPATMADVTALESATGFHPSITVDEGVSRFVEWYRGFYRIKDS